MFLPCCILVDDAGNTTASSTSIPRAPLVSFSSMDLTANSKTARDKEKTKEKAKMATSLVSASLYSSTERAVEVLAGLVGRTHVKEEIVHGSYR